MTHRYSPTAAERQARDEAPAQQLAHLHQQLTASVVELVNGLVAEMLTAAARFHSCDSTAIRQLMCDTSPSTDVRHMV
jgi:hypothetical protein